jgi:hypothetical protein
MNEGKVKGTILIQVVKLIRSRKEEGRRLVPEHLQHYLSGRILPTSWHPEEDFLALMHASTELFGGPGSVERLDSWFDAGRATAPAYFDEAYRMLVRKGDPGRTLASYGTIWKLRHDTGTVQYEALSDNESSVRLDDYALLSDKMCATLGGELAGLLDSAGAQGVEVSHLHCRARGDATCEWLVKWDPV